MKTLKLAVSKNALVPDGVIYKVITAKNSTDYTPGEHLLKDVVDALCHNPRWEVTIISLNS